MNADPIQQFIRWLDEAANTPLADPHAMTLATTGLDGTPSARTVMLKAVDERGFIFTSRYDSEKAEELRRQPDAALVFYWAHESRQIRARGLVEHLPAGESAELFSRRPSEQQIAIHALPSSAPIPSRDEMERRFDEAARSFENREIPPADWGGYVLRPSIVDFWQGRNDRLHDRFRYVLEPDGNWLMERLTP